MANFLQKIALRMELSILERLVINSHIQTAIKSDPVQLDRFAQKFAKAILPYTQGQNADKYFQLWENHGYHILPVSHYSPVPHSRTLKDDLWDRRSKMVGVDMNEGFQLELLRDIFPNYRSEYNTFPLQPTDSSYDFYYENGFFSGTDPAVLHSMVRHFKPNLIIEVGSGFSTRVSAKASLMNGNTKLICIEPYPAPLLREGLPGVTQLIEKEVQQIDLDFFQTLEPNDILFIDTSHVSKVGGEVNYLFLEVLPRIKKGVIIHIHDIVLPLEYGKYWIVDAHMFSNEQYILQALLTHNSEFEVVFASVYMMINYEKDMRTAFPNAPGWAGGSFWIRRKL